MTCIAYKDGVIAADTQETFGTRKIVSAGKVWRVPSGPNKGHYLCMSGESFVGQKLTAWYQDPKNHEMPVVASDPADDEALVEFLVVTPKRELFLLNEVGVLVPIKKPTYYAIGSGGDYAMMAMRCGKGAREAVRLACEFDSYCSPPIEAHYLPALKKTRR